MFVVENMVRIFLPWFFSHSHKELKVKRYEEKEEVLEKLQVDSNMQLDAYLILKKENCL